jgi:hypothetical protein
MFNRKLTIVSLLFILVPSTLGQREERFVVLPAGAARTIRARVVGDVDSYGSWQPSKADIDGLESNLAQISQLKITGWSSNIRIEHPERYFRQYIGVTHAQQRRIYINAFCDEPPPPDWRSRFYEVIDGATCDWQALYNPATKRFSNLTINPRA